MLLNQRFASLADGYPLQEVLAMKQVTFLTAIALGLLTVGCGRSISINVTDGSPSDPVAPPAQASTTQTAPAQPAASAQPVQPQPVAAAPQPVAAAPAQAPALAGANNSYIVRTRDGNGVNVRASNSTQAAKIASLADGTVVLVHLSDRSGEWVEVSAPNRIRGWVAARFLQPASGQSTSTAGPAPVANAPAGTLRVRTVDGDGLNVRAEPVLTARILTTIANGTPVTYQETVGQWTLISTPDGVTGYVVSEYLVAN